MRIIVGRRLQQQLNAPVPSRLAGDQFEHVDKFRKLLICQSPFCFSAAAMPPRAPPDLLPQRVSPRASSFRARHGLLGFRLLFHLLQLAAKEIIVFIHDLPERKVMFCGIVQEGVIARFDKFHFSVAVFLQKGCYLFSSLPRQTCPKRGVLCFAPPCASLRNACIRICNVINLAHSFLSPPLIFVCG